jgi:hypothetical protein
MRNSEFTVRRRGTAGSQSQCAVVLEDTYVIQPLHAAAQAKVNVSRIYFED